MDGGKPLTETWIVSMDASSLTAAAGFRRAAGRGAAGDADAVAARRARSARRGRPPRHRAMGLRRLLVIGGAVVDDRVGRRTRCIGCWR